MKNLTKFVQEQNFRAKFFLKSRKPGEEFHSDLDVNALTPTDMAKLYDQLSCDLSPENLCCDGELRGAKLRSKAAYLNGAKNELIALPGFVLELCESKDW